MRRAFAVVLLLAACTAAADSPVILVSRRLVAPAAPLVTSPVHYSEIGSSDETILVAGSSVPWTTIRVYVDGVSQGTWASDGTGTFTIHLPIALGTHDVGVRAENAAGPSPTVTRHVSVIYAGPLKGASVLNASGWSRNRWNSFYDAATGAMLHQGLGVSGVYAGNYYNFQFVPRPTVSGPSQSAATVAFVLEKFASKIGQNAQNLAMPPAWFDASWNPTFSTRSLTYPQYDNAAYFAMMLAGLVEILGDTSAWATYVDRAEAALESIGRDGPTGLLAVPGGRVVIDAAQHDMVNAMNGATYGTLMFAVAYQRLASAARFVGDSTRAATFDARLAALKAALSTARRSDGFYRPFIGDDKPYGLLTVEVLRYGMTNSDSERTASLAAVHSAYLAGNLTLRGYLRHLVKPASWGAITGGHQANTYEGGGYWLMATDPGSIGGGTFEGAASYRAEMGAEFMRQMRVGMNYAYEYINDPTVVVAGGNVEPFAGSTNTSLTIVESEGLAAYVDVAHPGDGSTVTVPVATIGDPAHRITKVEVLEARTGTLTVKAAARLNYLNDADPLPAATYTDDVTIATATLDGTANKLASTVRPFGVYGGRIKITATGGAMTVRLHQPSTVATTQATVGARFLADMQATPTGLTQVGAWTYNSASKRMQSPATQTQDYLLVTGINTTNVALHARVGNSPTKVGVVARRIDDNNRVNVFLQPSGGKWQLIVVSQTAGAYSYHYVGPADIPAGDLDLYVEVVGDSVKAWTNGVLRCAVGGVPVWSGTAGAYGQNQGYVYNLRAVALPADFQPIPPGYIVDGWDGTGSAPMPLIHGDPITNLVFLTGTTWTLRNNLGAAIDSGPAGAWWKYGP